MTSATKDILGTLHSLHSPIQSAASNTPCATSYPPPTASSPYEAAYNADYAQGLARRAGEGEPGGHVFSAKP
jgi:hypothetical protein